MKQLAMALIFMVCLPMFSAAQAHRIGVRVVNGQGEFYDTVTGASFLPRGHNYVRLANQIPPGGGTPFYYHSTFNTDTYDPVLSDNELANMAAWGYNTVRVWISHACNTCVINPTGPGLSAAYIANVVDFLNRAQFYNIYVVLTIDDLVFNDPYRTIANNGLDTTLFGAQNMIYLTPQSLAANQLYWSDFVTALAAANAPFTSILSYELRNELSFYNNQPPLSLTSGMVTTADGNTYDMSSATAKQQMMDSNLTVWFNTMVSAIKAVDPAALVSNSFLAPQTPYFSRMSDARVGNPYPATVNSTLDSIAFHPYLVTELDLAQYVANMGMANYPQKPVMMGEYGAFRRDIGTASAAAQLLEKMQVDSCLYNVKGWLLWTYDTSETQPPNAMWNAVDSGGTVGSALAPINRPNPCLPNDTTTTLTASAGAILKGASIRFTTTVIPSYSGLPTGLVPLKDNGTTMAILSLSGSSAAVFYSTSTLAAGLHWITSGYQGDANDMPSSGAPLGIFVNSLSGTTTTIRLGVNPVIAKNGQTVFLSAQVSSIPTATGTVSYYDNGVLLGSAGVFQGHAGGFSSATLSPGRHSITAVFFPGKSFMGSVSQRVELDVMGPS
jgi:hypothetical protein